MSLYVGFLVVIGLLFRAFGFFGGVLNMFGGLWRSAGLLLGF